MPTWVLWLYGSGCSGAGCGARLACTADVAGACGCAGTTPPASNTNAAANIAKISRSLFSVALTLSGVSYRSIRSSGASVADHLLESLAVILQNDCSGVAPGQTSDRAPGLGTGPRLVQTGNRHAVGREVAPALVPVVHAAAPHRRIHALDIQRTHDHFCEHLVLGEVHGVAQVLG